MLVNAFCMDELGLKLNEIGRKNGIDDRDLIEERLKWCLMGHVLRSNIFIFHF